MRLILFLLLMHQVCYGQTSDSVFIRSIYNEALNDGHSYANLRSLCKDVGARLSGSIEAQMAVEWSENLLKNYAFDSVYLQPIMVPHWERGTTEAAYIKRKDGTLHKLNILALGGSIGTNGIIRGELVVFESLASLMNEPQGALKDKMVLINEPMNPADIVTFQAYGGCIHLRTEGAVEAAQLGAKGILIRSLGLPQDDHPHTGSMHYDETVTKIPAAALSTNDSEWLGNLAKEETLELILEMDCRKLPDAPSFNVIAEMRGTRSPNKIITIGGHLDSWDAGEGAHDDGAGIIHSLEALRLLQVLNYKPNHTLRVVFFMNEENGNMGGKTYATWVKNKNEQHVAAIESDRGGFAPRGFEVDGPDAALTFLQSKSPLFKPYLLHHFERGYGGVDIGPLKNEYPEIALFGFVPDSQRYFDFHHTEADVFENVNKRELELGCAAMASLVYLLDKGLKW